jgi:hypothetical protein
VRPDDGADEARAGQAAGHARRQRQVRAGRPRGERLGVHLRAEVRPDHGEVLLQIEPWREVRDRLLAIPHLGRRRRRLQPGRQRLFPDRRPGRRQALEQRSGAEEIQIDRVGMRLVAEAPAAPVSRRGAVLDARDPVVVEADGALDPLAPLDDARVSDDQNQECPRRRQEPNPREPVGLERQHRDRDNGEEHGQAGAGHDAVDAPEPRRLGPPHVAPAGVSVEGRCGRLVGRGEAHLRNVTAETGLISRRWSSGGRSRARCTRRSHCMTSPLRPAGCFESGT